MIDCRTCSDLISLHLEGMINETQLDELKMHTDGCESCRKGFESLGLVQDIVQESFSSQTSAEQASTKVLDRLAATPHVRIRASRAVGARQAWTRGAIAAAVLLAIGLTIGFGLGKATVPRPAEVTLPDQVPMRVSRLSGTVLVKHDGFDKWEALQPVIDPGAVLPSARSFSVMRWSHPVFRVVPPADWKRLALTEGILLPAVPTAGSIAFLEPSYKKVGDPVPWSPTTYAELPQGLPHAISVMPDPRSPEGALVDLNLRYHLPRAFDPSKPVTVWLNAKQVKSVLPRTEIGMVRIRDIKPGKHLIRVVTGQADAHVYINAMPTEFLGAPRHKSRQAVIVPANGRIGVKVERATRDPQTIHIPIYLADAQPEDFKGRKSVMVEVALERTPPPAPEGALRRGSTRRVRRFIVPLEDPQAVLFGTGGGKLFRSGGMVFFPMSDDLPPGFYTLNVKFPPGLSVLIRPFMRVEREVLKRPSFRMVYEPLPEER